MTSDRQPWPEVALGEVAEIVCGGTPKTTVPGYWVPEVDWVTAKDVSECEVAKIGRTERCISRLGLAESSAKLLPAQSTVVIARGATMGKCRMIARPMAINQTCYGIVARAGTDPVYLYYCLCSLQGYFQTIAHGSVFNTVIGSGLHSLRIHLPPLAEQHAIAHILGALDDKIELNRRMNETLEAIARAIFKSWFVDFDPVRAKAERRQPVGIDARTAELFPDAFEDSPLGKVPQGWKVAAIGEIVKVVGGSTPSTKEPTFWGGTINFATPKDLSSLSSQVLLDTERCITDAGLQCIGSGLLPTGTVLLSSRAPIGYLAIAATPVAVNQGIIAMVCDGDLPNYYVLHWARENLEAIMAVANGTTFLEVSKRNFRPINVVVPPVAILAHFARVMGPLHQRVLSNLGESRTLATLRDTLLPKLLSGEIRVREAEKAVERIV